MTGTVDGSRGAAPARCRVGRKRRAPEDPVASHVGRAIARHRETAGLSKAQLAEAAGLTVLQLHSYETARNAISVVTLCRLAAVLGLPVASFFDGLQRAPRGAGWRACQAEADAAIALGRQIRSLPADLRGPIGSLVATLARRRRR